MSQRSDLNQMSMDGLRLNLNELEFLGPEQFTIMISLKIHCKMDEIKG